MQNSDQTTSAKGEEKFLYESPIYLLGIDFVENDRTTFVDKVHKMMHKLGLQVNGLDSDPTEEVRLFDETILSQLLSVQLSIPANKGDKVKINFDSCDDSLGKLEKLWQRTAGNNKALFEANAKQLQTLFDKLSTGHCEILANHIFLYRFAENLVTERCLTFTTIFSNETPLNGEGGNLVHRHQTCYVLLAESPAQVTEIVEKFRQIHGTPQKLNDYKVVINCEVEIQEQQSEGKWHTCPREKDSFRLRTNVNKRICIKLNQDMTQYCFPVIHVERCFGMLLSPGRGFLSDDMFAIGHNSMSTSAIVGTTNPIKQWQIIATWIPSEINFECLNTETPRDNRVFFTIALDLVIENIDEPVRFIFEAKAKIVHPPHSMAASATEKFWNNFTSKSGKHLSEQFNMIVRQRSTDSAKYDVISCQSQTQIQHQKQRLNLQLNQNRVEDSLETPMEEDDDEPLQSGTGLVSKECSQNELQDWKQILDRWHSNLEVRPKQLPAFVRQGIPQALRPEVWQLLSGAIKLEKTLMLQYKTFVNQPCQYEAIIQRDIYRTFPAHEKFREPGSIEQESLLRICKAYSNYDPEVGYCQGLSFLVAALLLQMPEEQAFCVFVRIMYDYGLRVLYLNGMIETRCKFYQLSQLIDDHMPDLYIHFADLNIETQMFAAQWFLTLFTTKFPLNVVFRIIDLFLLEKMDVLFKISLALLKMSKPTLLALDFDGILKYFRVSLPKKYRNAEACDELIRLAIKFNVRKAAKYERVWRNWMEEERQRLNPLETLELENKRLMLDRMRLEQENDDLAQELLTTCTSKMKLHSDLSISEDKAITLNALLLQSQQKLVDVEEERACLVEEVKNLKDMYRREIEKAEADMAKDEKIIEEYKSICRNYQNKFEVEKDSAKKRIGRIVNLVKDCDGCSKLISEAEFGNENGDTVATAASSKDNADVIEKVLELEKELINAKMTIAQSEARNEALVGKLNTTMTELNSLRAHLDETTAQQNHKSNTWLSRTVSSIQATMRTSHSNHGGLSSIAQSEISSNHTGGSEPAVQNNFRRSNSKQ